MSQEEFMWGHHPQAETLLLTYLEGACSLNGELSLLRDQLVGLTSTRLFDWIDHFAFGPDEERVAELVAVGFIEESVETDCTVFYHPKAQLPSVVIYSGDKLRNIGVKVQVDSVVDFLMVRGLGMAIEGTPHSGYRRVCISIEEGVGFWVVERRGTRTMVPTIETAEYQSRYSVAVEKWRCRPRTWEDETEALNQAKLRGLEMVQLVGRDTAASIVLECERDYWQSRNRAGQRQKQRQDHLGMGWGNHDHHTFRSSRALFLSLVQLFEEIGFTCRERFYAGEEAGWGAQVMENRAARGVLFLDVDLCPGEVAIDFAHQALPPGQALGTIGLWCSLHGDSILQAGMHHLEGQFIFDLLRDDLADEGIGMMDPFSNFEHLRQAFTEGEQWPVAEKRLNILVEEGLIAAAEADRFRQEGAIGSHLENLQRREGFKGFNQENVSYIIEKTDPRL